MSACIRENLYKIPGDIDLVVGVPRSGMLAASIIGLSLNTRITDIEAYLADSLLAPDNTRKPGKPAIKLPSQAQHVLVVDDSIRTGGSLRTIKDRLCTEDRVQTITFCTVYATLHSAPMVDVFFEVLENPRSFEWNMFHRPLLAQCCVDIDGIICLDPTQDQNDDGAEYLDFLGNAKPLVKPTYLIGHLVTSRLEKYRAETEGWLKKHNIEYGKLHMLDLPDAATRQKMNCHAEFKAGVYRSIKDAVLFLESEPHQADKIANQSGKPALCFKTQKMHQPGASVVRLQHQSYTFKRKFLRQVKKKLRMANLYR